MSRDLSHEYVLLKEQYAQGLLTANQYLRGMKEIADAYIQVLDDNGLMLQPLEVPVDA